VDKEQGGGWCRLALKRTAAESVSHGGQRRAGSGWSKPSVSHLS
jgi:hypothetical protein